MTTASESVVSNLVPHSEPGVRNIELHLIDVGPNPHRFSQDSPEDVDLAADIKANGLLQPLIVRPVQDRYELLAGHRRLAALQSLHARQALCCVRSCEEDEGEQVTFAENFFRKDLTPLELAVAIARAYKSGKLTVEQLAIGFKKSPDWVRRQVAITAWPEDVLDIIHRGAVSIAAAANLALVEEPAYREFLCRQAAENGATARTTAAWLQAWRAMLPPKEAIHSAPVPAGSGVLPMIPQAPCLCCGTAFRTDELIHVPVCRACMRVLREAQPPGPGGL